MIVTNAPLSLDVDGKRACGGRGYTGTLCTFFLFVCVGFFGLFSFEYLTFFIIFIVSLYLLLCVAGNLKLLSKKNCLLKK